MRVEWNYGRPLQLYMVDYHFQCLPKSLISPVLIHSEYASMVTKPLHFLWLVPIHFCFNQPFFYGISINHLFILFWRVYYVSNHSNFFFWETTAQKLIHANGSSSSKKLVHLKQVKNWSNSILFTWKKKKNVFAYLPLGDIFRS